MTTIAEALKKLPMSTEAEWQEAKRRTDLEWAKVKLPPGYVEVTERLAGTHGEGARMVLRGKTSILFSAGPEAGEWWLHVSMAHPDRMPTYMDLVELKRVFVGRDRQAVQIFPAESEHVNIHSRALHLWASLEEGGDGLPHFGQYGTI